MNTRKNTAKRILTMLLCMAMIITSLPLQVFAEEEVVGSVNQQDPADNKNIDSADQSVVIQDLDHQDSENGGLQGNGSQNSGNGGSQDSGEKNEEDQGSIDQSLVVNFLPGSAEVASGSIQNMRLTSSYAAGATGGSATVRIFLPEQAILTSFVNGSYTVDNDGKQTVIYLRGQGADRYLEFDIAAGSSCNADIPITTLNGLTANDTRMDFSVTCTGAEGTAPQIRCQGYTVKAGFAWNQITETTGVGKTYVQKGGILKDDIPYTIVLNPQEAGMSVGVIYTGLIIVENTVEFPSGIAWKAGELRLNEAGDKVELVLDGTGDVVDLYTLTGIPQGAAVSLSATANGFSLTYTYDIKEEQKQNGAVQGSTSLIDGSMTLQGFLYSNALSADIDKLDNASITNSVSMKAESVLGDRFDSSASVKTDIADPQAVVTLKKETSAGNNAVVKKGDILTYTITAANTGVKQASGDITDIIPKGTVFNKEATDKLAGSQGYAYDGQADTVTWNGVELEADSEKSFAFAVTVEDSDIETEDFTIENMAVGSFSSGRIESNKVSNIYRVPKAVLAIEKTNDKGEGGELKAGEKVTYTITAANSGDRDAEDKTVTDILPDCLTFAAVNKQPAGSGFVQNGQVLTFDHVRIQAGGKAVFEIAAELSEAGAKDLKNGADIVNKAVIDVKDSQGQELQAVSQLKYHKVRPDLVLTKDSSGMQNPGSDGYYTLPYVLKVENKGDMASEIDVIRDIMSSTSDTSPLLPVSEKQLKESGIITGTAFVNGEDKGAVQGTYQKVSPDKLEKGYEVQFEIKWSLPSIAPGSSYEIHYNGYYKTSSDDRDSGEIVVIHNSAILENFKYEGGNPGESGPGQGPGGSGGSGSGSTETEIKSEFAIDKYISKVNSENKDKLKKSAIYPGDILIYDLVIKNSGNMDGYVSVTDNLPVMNNSMRWKLEDDPSIKDGDAVIRILSDQFGENPTSVNYGGTVPTLFWKKLFLKAGETKTLQIALTYPSGENFIKAFTQSGKLKDVTNKLVVMPVTAGAVNVADRKKLEAEVTMMPTQPTLGFEKYKNTGNDIPSGSDVTFYFRKFGTSGQSGSFSHITLEDNLQSVFSKLYLKSIGTGKFTVTDEDGKTITPVVKLFDIDEGKAIQIHSQEITQDEEITDPALIARTDKVVWDFGRNVKSLKIEKEPSVTCIAKAGTFGTVRNTAFVYMDEEKYRSNSDYEDVTVLADSQISKEAYDADGNLLDNETNVLKEGETVYFKIRYKNLRGSAISNWSWGNIKIQDYLSIQGLENGAVIQPKGKIIDTNGGEREVEIGFWDNSFGTVYLGDTQVIDNTNPNKETQIYRFSVRGNVVLDNGETLEISYSAPTGENYYKAAGNRKSPYAVSNTVKITIDNKEKYASVGPFYPALEDKVWFQKGVKAVGTYAGTVWNAQEGLGNTKYSETTEGIAYTAVLYNPITSKNNITAKSIVDTLPEGFTWGGLFVTSETETLRTAITTSSGKAPVKAPSEGVRFISASVKAEAGQDGNVYLTPDESSWVLKPGEAIAFGYVLKADKDRQGTAYADNGAKRNVAVLEVEGAGPNPNTPISFRADSKKGLEANEGGCSLLRQDEKSTYYSSEVAVAKANVVPGVQKAAAQVKNDSGSWEDIKEGTELRTYSEISWKITVTNNSQAETDLSEFVLRDDLPYPYSMTKMTVSYPGKAEKDITKEIAVRYPNGEDSAQNPLVFGKTHQELTYQASLKKSGSIAPGESAVFTLYTKPGNRVKYQTFVNKAVLTPHQTFANIDCGVWSNDKKSISHQAEVSILGAFASHSYKTITNEKGDSATGTGDASKDFVLAESAGDKVNYGLYVKNTSKHDFTDFVIIDRMPEEGDTGVINLGQERDSQFTVNVTGEKIKAIYDGRELVKDQDYYAAYSAKTSFSANDWKGTTAWDNSPAGAKTLRLTFKDGFKLEAGKSISVEFEGQIADDAAGGEIAWNSFGYHYSAGGLDLYPEPARVGVKVKDIEPAEYRIVGRKILEGENAVLADGQFAFDLAANETFTDTADFPVQHVTNRADGSFEFPVQSYHKAGEYTYFIRENTEAGDQNYTYDHSIYKVTVKAENADGRLNVSHKVAKKAAGEIEYNVLADYGEEIAITFTNTKNKEPEIPPEVKGVITVNKNFVDAKGDPIELADYTVYAGLFTNEELSGVAEQWKPIHVANASTGGVTFTDLALGTYYVSETDEDGYAITDDGYYTATVEQGVCSLTKENPYGTAFITNTMKTPPPGELEEDGSIIIKKQVLRGGKPLGVKDTFYFALFKDSGCTELASSIASLELDGESQGSVKFTKLAYGTYYVAETDSKGQVISASSGFGYEVTASSESCELKDTNKTAEVEITNTKKEEQIPTPTPKGKITVEKSFFNAEGEPADMEDYTIYAGLFKDPAMSDVAEHCTSITVSGSSYGTAVFTGLELGTWYVSETDEDGYAITDDGFFTAEVTGGTCNLTREAPEATAYIRNTMKSNDPGHLEEDGRIIINKKVEKDGKPLDVTDTFYFALFKDAEYTELASDVVSLELEGASQGSLEFAGLAYGTYYVAETDAAGNPLALSGGDTGYTIQVSGGVCRLDEDNKTAEVTVTNLKSGNSQGKGSITVNKVVMSKGQQLAMDDYTIYTALFSDQELTQRVSSIHAIHLRGTATGSTEFANLEPGTYYVAETDEDGYAMEDDGFFTAEVTDGTCVITAGGNHETATITNTLKVPDDGHLEEDGSIRIDKTVVKNGAAHKVTDTFYFALFSDAGYTKRVSDVVSLDFSNASEGSLTFDKLAYGTYYVAETDKNGKVVSASAGFAYSVNISHGLCTLSDKSKSAQVKITNALAGTGGDRNNTNTFTNTVSRSTYSSSSKTSSVKTGDETTIAWYLILLACAAAGIAVTSARRKKSK